MKKSLKVNSALELNSASVCVQTGTTTEQNLADYFKSNNMKYEVIAFGTADETVKAYESGRCDVFTSDVSQLYAEAAETGQSRRSCRASRGDLEGAARPDGPPWRRPMFDLVKWVLFATVDAEELGVTRRTSTTWRNRTSPSSSACSGADGNLGEQLGVTKDWVLRIVKAVGNYGEMFDRNVGAGSKLALRAG